jgi:hypothetical protein
MPSSTPSSQGGSRKRASSPEVAHGCGDRSEYYKRWDAAAAAAAAEAEAAAHQERAASDAALGLDSGAPRSAAEEADRTKRAALAEAKKGWEAVETRKNAQVSLEQFSAV